MEKGRSGDDDGVHFLGRDNFLKGVRAGEELRRVHNRKVLGLQELVEVSAGGVKLVLEEIGEGDDTGAGVKKIGGVFCAAAAAAEQSDADGRVGLRAAHQRWVDDHEAGGGGS